VRGMLSLAKRYVTQSGLGGAGQSEL